MPYFFLLFVIMPIVEIAVLIKVGGAIGAWTTIGIVILTAFIGTFMLRQQGMATLGKAQQRIQSGEMPAQQMLEGLLLLIGGILLLTPGFITDLFGFCTLVPISRQFLANKLLSGVLGNMNVFVGGAQVNPSDTSDTEAGRSYVPGGTLGGQPRPDAASQSPHRNKPSKGESGDSEVLEGDYQRLD